MIHWNMPGYGQSDCYLDAPLAHDYAALLHQLVTQLGIKKFILVGHSLGALIAYAYSKQYGDSLKGLFLASCTRGYGDKTSEVKENIANLRPSLYQEKGQQAYIDTNLSRLAHSVTGEKYAIIKQVISNIGFLGIKASSHLLAYSRIDVYKHSVNVPFHMVCGEDDKITEFEDVKRLSQELGAQFTPIPNAGHPCYLENEHAFNHALLHFIEQVKR
jgi:pimeloyl-ACP methyl ester carboxylesterase